MSLASPAGAASDPVKDRTDAQSKADRAVERMATAETALAEAEAQTVAIEAKSAATRQRLVGLRERVRALAVTQYVRPGEGEAVMFGGDAGQTARNQALARFVNLADHDALQLLRRTQQELDGQQTALRHAASEQVTLAASVRRERSDAVEELARIATIEQAFLAKQEVERAAAAKRAASTASAASRSAASAAAAAAAAAKAPPAPAAGGATGVIASGSWICPVQGPRSFTNDWGQPRSGGRGHQGTDMLSPRGTPVVASVSGTVRHHNSGLGGLSYYLTGDDGHTYFGTHLSGYAASGRVQAGTVVGYVGDSGNARGTNHLHFEIHPGGGAPANPYPTLRANC